MRYVIFVLLALVSPVGVAQNLVPNGSFEEYMECPSTYSQFARVVAWESIQGSPDLLNACCASDSAGVPLNFLGDQPAYEGVGYAGVGTAGLFCKEYMQVELTMPMIPGVPTYVSMRVSPGGFGVPGTTSPQLVSSGIGLRFSVQRLDYFITHGQFDYDTAVVFMSEILNDTASWQNVSGILIPDSAYRYAQIGNFFSSENTITDTLDIMGDWGCAYSFIDAVCVSQSEGVCDVASGIDLLTGLDPAPQVSLSDGVLSIRVPEGHNALMNALLTDPVGRMQAMVPRIEEGTTALLPFAHRSAGIYMLAYQMTNGRVGVVRFVHIQP
ncbi:MAG: hypothetical protein KBF80_14210 [Flavobacteriales bacterium]|nr:hypothetical protein [Flavobacteriales bacterium]